MTAITTTVAYMCFSPIIFANFISLGEQSREM